MAGTLTVAACGSPPPVKHPTTTTVAPGMTTTTARATSSSTTTTTAPSARLDNVATFAEAPGKTPAFISPITPTGYATVANTAQFSSLMWRPLVWPGTGEQLGPDPTKSLYSSIDYNSNDTSVTITLKDWAWSDGQPVTARDLSFFLDLVRSNKSAWSGYVPGQFPDNIASATVTGERTLLLKLKGAWSQFWFTDDQLSLITPVPQHVWDKESTSGKVGNYDETVAGARSVWTYLESQARDTATFATNPLWKTVDGPWMLRSFGTGQATFVPNPAYSGSDPPALASFQELAFANGTEEVDALAAGRLDVGYLPQDLLADRSVLHEAGFGLAPWVGLDLAGIIPNLTNPKVAPLLHQAYIRQALQELVDQKALVSSVFGGFASASYGPVPLAPANNPYAAPPEQAAPYPFSITKATNLLTAHGWQAGTPGTPRTCVNPRACGPGITQGEALSMNLSYPSGDATLAEELEVIKSAAVQAGVLIKLVATPPASFARQIKPCTSTCSWQLATYQGYPYSIEPTGEGLFVKGSPGDLGGYNDATNTANVAASLHDNGPSEFYDYVDYLVTQVPWIWLPSRDYQLTEVSSTLKGVTPQDAYLYLSPEDWSSAST